MRVCHGPIKDFDFTFITSGMGYRSSLRAISDPLAWHSVKRLELGLWEYTAGMSLG